MRPNEVMIFDWFLYQDILTRKAKMGQIEADDYNGSELYFSALHPIRITKSILLANGFEENGNYHLLKYNAKDWPNHSELKYMFLFDDFEGQRMENDLWVSKIFTRVKYVHELQHALRVLGLTDFADHFKIQ